MHNDDLLPESAPEETAPQRKKRTARNVLLGFLAVVLIAGVVSGFYVYNLANSFNTKTQKIENAFPEESTRPTKPELPNGGDAMNILVLGSDSRSAPVNTAEKGAPSDQRSDSMMLLHIPADRKNIFITSIMRDTWVEIPGHGSAKINAAMAFGGIPLVVQTVEGILDARIDHVAVIDFEGFKSMTDALGGVEVNVPLAFSTKHFDFAKGKQTLDGDHALAFVRERYAFADGDYQRVKNQQLFLKALMGKFLTTETLTNPAKISSVVDQVSPYVSVDQTLDAMAVGKLAVELRNVRAGDVESFTLPNSGTGWSEDGQSIVVPDQAAIDALKKALKEDKVGEYLAAQGIAN
ncbi:transcriptional regulator [Arthrobacter sp. SW1]|uniref:LCP family protein n=1 Tax=Arthrobacter sp. SW1 TaxID=1920889 RepID=UPI000877DF05|nr:LCP family protein [Arthrobacter sp. SW1]OFI39666.1 transcriptional regulator [Arthrobacter sp. SW1]